MQLDSYIPIYSGCKPPPSDPWAPWPVIILGEVVIDHLPQDSQDEDEHAYQDVPKDKWLSLSGWKSDKSLTQVLFSKIVNQL